MKNPRLSNHNQSLLESAVSDRYRSHYLWLPTEYNLGKPKNIARQAIFIWYPEEKADLKVIHDEANVLPHDELNIARFF